MNRRTFNIAYVSAELRAKLNIKRFEKEFEDVPATKPNPNQPIANPRPTDNAGGNVPQQPVYGG